MKVLVFSDSHGEIAAMRRILLAQEPDCVFYLGDGNREAETLKTEFPRTTFRCVRGNCDFVSSAPDTDLCTLEGVTVFLTHGHIYGVKRHLEPLIQAGASRGAALILYGHTHQADYRQLGGMQILNPGSIGLGRPPSYGELILSGGAAEARIVPL